MLQGLDYQPILGNKPFLCVLFANVELVGNLFAIIFKLFSIHSLYYNIVRYMDTNAAVPSGWSFSFRWESCPIFRNSHSHTY